MFAQSYDADSMVYVELYPVTQQLVIAKKNDPAYLALCVELMVRHTAMLMK
jgi:hypothetical protein